MTWTLTALVVSVFAMLVAAYFYRWVKNLPVAGEGIMKIGQYIRDGAFTFLKREYRILTVFVVAASVVVLLVFPRPIWEGGVTNNILAALSYIIGSCFSGLAGYIGIRIATIANVRSASAARKGLIPAYMAGFRGGAV